LVIAPATASASVSLSATSVLPRSTTQQTPNPTSTRCADLPLSTAVPGAEGSLVVVYPMDTSVLVGGQTLRLSVMLTDDNGEGVEKAKIKANEWPPEGEKYAELLCQQAGQGRYLSEPFRLPLRSSEGKWIVDYLAQWGMEHKQRSVLRLPRALPTARDCRRCGVSGSSSLTCSPTMRLKHLNRLVDVIPMAMGTAAPF